MQTINALFVSGSQGSAVVAGIRFPVDTNEIKEVCISKRFSGTLMWEAIWLEVGTSGEYGADSDVVPEEVLQEIVNNAAFLEDIKETLIELDYEVDEVDEDGGFITIHND